MLRLRRKQQKAAARLTNFINKQPRENLITYSFATGENRLSLVTGAEPWTSLCTEAKPLNFLMNERKNANKEENRPQNTSEKPQKDILVDSSYLHLHTTTTEALKTSPNHLPDDGNYSLTKNFSKNLSISYLHPNSAYPHNFGWLSLDLENDINNEPCLTKFYAPYIINNLIKLTACESGAVRLKQIQHSIVYEINKSYKDRNFLNTVNLKKLNAFLRDSQQIIVHHMDHMFFDLCFFWYIPFPRRDNCGVPRDPNKPHIKKIRLDFPITAINSYTTPANSQHIFTYFKEYPPPFVIITSTTIEHASFFFFFFSMLFPPFFVSLIFFLSPFRIFLDLLLFSFIFSFFFSFV